MFTAKVKMLNLNNEYPELGTISAQLDQQEEKLNIDTINWPEYSYRPEVKLSLGHSQHEVFLKFYISEHYFKAEKIFTNQPVYEDSCVEFFVSPGDDGIYYNMEFNAIGTCLMGVGTSRDNNTVVDPVIVSKIRRLSSIGDIPVSEREGRYEWDLTIAVPLEVLFLHEIREFNEKSFRANFYKCGDKLTAPHYLSWNRVGTLRPDFHQPDFFGLLTFI